MVGDALNFINTVFSAVGSWFMQVMNATDGGGVYVAIVFIVLSVRFLLWPLFYKGAGSDLASNASKLVPKSRRDGNG